jgi:threonine/homoserine/homoserine lactone efflux protein
VLGAFLVGMVLAFFGSIPVAGPIAVAVLAMGLRHANRGALFIATGAAVAEAIYASVAFVGASAVLARFPTLLPVAHIVGGVALIAVGVYLVVQKPKSKEAAKQSDRKTGPRKLLVGFSLTIINPTLLVTWTAAISAAHSSGVLHLGTRNALPFALGVCGGVIAWFALALGLLTALRDRVKQGTVNGLVHAMGVVLAALGIFLTIRGLIRS